VSNEASVLKTIQKRLAERRSVEWDVVGLGECSIDEVWVLPGAPEWGQKTHAVRRERLGGGQVATAMVACARLGLRAAYLGVVGDDEPGGAVIEGLTAEGVDAGDVLRTRGATRSAIILVDGDSGERTVVEHVDRHVTLHPSELPDRALSHARVLHIDATHLPASLAAARLARELGVIVSLDVDHARPGLDELLALTDVCITSEGVPHELTGEADLEQALRALGRKTGPLVGCTLGSRGAAALDDGHLLLSPAFPADVVDTTACGDTFHAGAIAALLDGKSVGEILRFANAAAALKCRDLGRRGCPTKPEVNALLARV
jgi:sugar/nucleoside kinase (ribokinase family)